MYNFSKTDLSHILYSERKNTKEQHKCDYEQNGFCKSDCPSKHSSKGIICRKSIGGGCSDNKCRYQHPNQRLVEKTLKVIYVNKGLDTDDQQKKFLKKYVVKCPVHMAKDICQNPLCYDSNCKNQHFEDVSVIGKQAFDLQKTLSIHNNGARLVDCPPSSFEYELLASAWKEKKASRQIVKVEKVINPALTSVIEKRKAELKYDWQEIDFLFHGTKETTIPLIISNGFDASKNVRAAWGPGIYFAFDPNTAISYSGGDKKLIVCKAFLAKDGSDHRFVEQNTWFVVQNTSGLQPMYVLTFA